MCRRRRPTGPARRDGGDGWPGSRSPVPRSPHPAFASRRPVTAHGSQHDRHEPRNPASPGGNCASTKNLTGQEATHLLTAGNTWPHRTSRPPASPHAQVRVVGQHLLESHPLANSSRIECTVIRGPLTLCSHVRPVGVNLHAIQMAQRRRSHVAVPARRGSGCSCGAVRVLRGAVSVQLSAPSRQPHKPLTSTNTRSTAVRALIPINALSRPNWCPERQQEPHYLHRGT